MSKNPKTPGIGTYLVAALLANVPMMFLVLALSFSDPGVLSIYPNLSQIVFFSCMFGGAAVATFFVARRFESRTNILGLVIGSLSYAIYFVYSLFFYQGYTSLGGFWPIVAFVLGGVVGGQASGAARQRGRME